MLAGPELEKMIYQVIRMRPDLYDVLSSDYFHTKELKACYKIDKKFYGQYTTIPTVSQISKIVKINKKMDGLLNDDILQSIFDVDLDQYDAEWLEKQIDSWIKHRTAESIIIDSANLMRQEITTDNIDVIVDQVYTIFRDRAGIDYRFEKGSDFFNPHTHFQPPGDYFSMGYPYMDKMTSGGWELGTLYVIAGTAKAGKSVWAANLAANSVRLGYETAVITLEMKETKYIKRIGANLLNISMDEYDNFSANPKLVQEKLEEFKLSNTYLTKPGNLFIKQYPASTAGVPDIENYLRRLEETERVKLQVVVVDYINIMKNWRNPNTENLYSKIKQIAEDLRAMATRNNWAVLTLTQLNRNAYDSSDISLSNIAESAGLIHTVDALFGIMRNSNEHGRYGTYRMKALALRNAEGAGSEQEFTCDFDYMQITENQESSQVNDFFDLSN